MVLEQTKSSGGIVDQYEIKPENKNLHGTVNSGRKWKVILYPLSKIVELVYLIFSKLKGFIFSNSFKSDKGIVNAKQTEMPKVVLTTEQTQELQNEYELLESRIECFNSEELIKKFSDPVDSDTNKVLFEGLHKTLAEKLSDIKSSDDTFEGKKSKLSQFTVGIKNLEAIRELPVLKFILISAQLIFQEHTANIHTLYFLFYNQEEEKLDPNFVESNHSAENVQDISRMQEHAIFVNPFSEKFGEKSVNFEQFNNLSCPLGLWFSSFNLWFTRIMKKRREMN